MPLTETPLQRLVNSSLGLHARYMAGAQRQKAYRLLELKQSIPEPFLDAFPDEQPGSWFADLSGYPPALSTDLAGDETSPPR